MTAKEFLRNKKNEIGLRSQSSPLGSESLEIEAMIEFAKYHVKRALEAADNNAKLDIIDREEISEGSFRPVYGVDSDSILNAYPLENIK